MQPVRSDYKRLLKTLQHSPAVLTAADALTRRAPVSVKQLSGSARSAFVSALWLMGDIPLVVVTPDDTATDQFAHDLAILLETENVAVMRLGGRASGVAQGTMLNHDHIDALQRMQERGRCVLVVNAAVLTQQVPVQAELATATTRIAVGDELHFDDFVRTCSIQGYERTDYVAKPGDMAVRGGIVDLFPAGWDNPLRLEFWGDTVESLREFEPLSQRSIREHQNVAFLGRVYHADDTVLSATVMDHIPAGAAIVLDQPEAVAGVLFDNGALTDWNGRGTLLLNPLGEPDILAKTHPQPLFSASIELALRSATSLNNRGVSVTLGADGQTNVKRIRDLFENIADQIELDAGASAVAVHNALHEMHWVAAALTEGFIWDDMSVACFTEHQIFGRQRTQKRSRKAEGGISLRDLQQLHRGEYVVHADKGVGRFEGLETINISGSAQECVKLAFAGTDVLYVHLNYVHKLSKFAAEEGAIPTLSKLGSPEWEKRKARAKKKIKDIARDLIELYARRKSRPGFAFPTDTIWQKELEASFQYEDTPDQARATSEVKHDMEIPSPMDRLVCGDVGFGKTEVAVRAAFKAAQAGKQVAVLVPTTILAHQHFLTFRDRLQRYPVKVDVMSRFRSRSEQKEVLEQLHSGQVDILIGTHRLLSKDVEFKNLGLLIIDEEHRFGVAAKEKLRAVKSSIDTLTLTATPIPRTLNFSLMGARDLSVIETPPRNRLPVSTEILAWNDDILRDALLRELERNGQAFVVTDRIGDMDKLKMHIQMLVPTLRVAIGHGQMPAEELEDVMEGFLERTYDVLIATKIIESGLDIPNANTMIIVNADNFGLAELYQLRGRVGRSNTQAYCYLVIPPVHTISRVALRRLQALEEFTDLGSGFQLAMRDLEIRGAGNLLGGEQSGFIMEMGFELYQKILDEAVSELRYEEFSELFGAQKPTSRTSPFTNEDVAIEVDRDALLPKSYIPGDTDRYDAYKRLYNAHQDSDVDAVFNELRDRFGALPKEADELHFSVRLRIAALPLGVQRVIVRGDVMNLEMPADTDLKYYEGAFPKILPSITAMRNARFVQNGKRLFVEVRMGRREEAPAILRQLSDTLLTGLQERTE